jgi:PAS domain S-box-containing protein
MLKKFLNSLKPKKKKITSPNQKESTTSYQGTVAVNRDDKSLGISFNDYESNLQVFSPNFNSGIVEEITGYSQEEFAKGLITWDQLVHPEDLHIFFQEDQRLKSNKGYVFNIEYRIIHKNGEIRWVKDIGRVLANPSELTPQLIGTICDITDKKR